MIRNIVKFFLYLLLVASMLVGGNLHILGPLSPRHISMLLLMSFAFLSPNSFNKIKVEGFILYLLYLAIYAFSNIINGEYYTTKFLQSFYTYHLPCISLVLGLPIIIKTPKDLAIMTKVIVTLYLVNIVFSLLQYVNFQPAWAFAQVLSVSAEEGVRSAEMYNDAYGSIIGYSVIMGLFGYSVANGYFIASYLPIASNRIQKIRGDFMLGLVVLALGAITTYVVQQRMAFLIIILYFLYLLLVRVKSKTFLLIMGLGFLIVYYLGGLNLDSVELGRLTVDTSNDNRIGIYHDFLDYISNPESIFGGQVAYFEKYHKYQHNTFTASWVAGGIFSFIAYCVLYVKLMRYCIVVINHRRKFNTQHFFSLSFALSSLFFLLYSLTHTDGVHCGSPMFWLSYSLLHCAIIFESNNTNYA